MLTILVLALGLMVCQVNVSEAAEMGTAFTYQGHLYNANHVADGLYDFSFRLYDANVGGSKAANDVNVGDVDVMDGYFTVELDFNDPNAFNGDARWLEIGVRAGELEDSNIYTPLSPRQQVTATPYALYARTVTELSKGPAYYTIAASDAPTFIKERADYVCDGTADDVQIQAAIDACVAIGGGGVLLSAGNFYIAATIEPRGDCKLKGMGVYATDLMLAANCDMFVYDSVAQEGFFHLEDMCLNGQKASYSGNCFATNDQLWDVYITRVFIHSFSGNGIYSEKCWGWKVINTFIEWCGGVGFYLAGGDGPYLSGCKFRQNNKDALRLSLGSSTLAIGCEFKALSAKPGSDNSTTFYVQVNCTGADVSGWEVGDVVRNYNDGGGSPGDDWTGVLNEVAYLADSDRLIITMDGAYDDTDVDLTDGIDNTTKSEQAGLDGKEAHRYAGVRIEAGAHDNKIIGCIFDMMSGHNCIGVFVASSRNTIIGNKFTYGHTGVFIPGGLNPVGGSYMGQEGSIIGNTFVSQSAEAIDIDKTSKNNIYGNHGYISQTMEKLSVTGDGASTTITVTHKLDDNKPSGTIRCFQITPASQKMGEADYWISADTATTFTITFSAPLENNETYAFYADAEFQRNDWDMTVAVP